MARIGPLVTIAPGVTVHPRAAIVGRALIAQQADLLVLGPVAETESFITAHRDRDLGVRVTHVCKSGAFSGRIGDYAAAAAKDQHSEARRAHTAELLAEVRAHFGL